jgi:acetyl-CoA C-acetyltransferase
MPGSHLVSTARTPIGKIGGALASLSAVELGALAIGAALERGGVAATDVDHVIMGQVLQAGTGQNPARQAAAKAGVPMEVPALTVNKVCLSGLYAIHLADQMIQAGEADVVVAGGMESMSNAPYLLPGARSGLRLGDATAVDSLVHDGLWCGFDDVHMGAGTDGYAEASFISRDAQDELAARSHERAAAATKEGRLATELAAVSIAQRKGGPIRVETDEGIRPGTTVETLARLRPAFSPTGTITAGNASQLSDGAAAVVVMSEAKRVQLGLGSRAEIVGYGMVAGPDASLLTQPSRAINRALQLSNRTLGDIDLFEINEAFAAVALASTAALGIGHDVVNVNGGAIAFGHPIASSGVRLAITLVDELHRRGGGLGAAALCGGGGQGDAALLKVTAAAQWRAM